MADCRLADRLLREQVAQFGQQAEQDADLLRVYRFCFRGATLLEGIAIRRRFRRELAARQRVAPPPVACFTATNAFGMGVDKEDVRVVIHADIPGSLANCIQEAGRAGRDREQAAYVLLYDPRDVETQFGLSSLSELTRRDIAEILRELRQIQWGEFAVLARSHEVLEPIRAVLEREGIPLAWHGDVPPLHRVREIDGFLWGLNERGRQSLSADDPIALVPEQQSVWRGLTIGLIEDWRAEAGESPVSAARIAEFCLDRQGNPVARLSGAAAGEWGPRLGCIDRVRILAMLRRDRRQSKSGFSDRCRAEQWAVPVAEIQWR